MRSQGAGDITGKRNGRLVAVRRVGVSNDCHALWLCHCDCGGTILVPSNALRYGTPEKPQGTHSCGCLRKEAQQRRRLGERVWNAGKSYAVRDGKKCYRTARAWAIAARRALGNKCQRCGWDKASCDVHHRIPKAKGGLNTLDNAEILCPNCHRIETASHPPMTWPKAVA